MKAPARMLALAALISVIPASALSWSHVAAQGETLKQLAVRYYGQGNMEMVIRAANGLVHPDDGSLMEGERVEIPEATYYKIAPGDTWDSIASRFLATPKRGEFLAELNGFKHDEMPPGEALIKIPYHLRHIFAPDESLRNVTRLYLGEEGSTAWLRKYNLTRKTKFKRGDVVIVPLTRLDFVPEERDRVARERDSLYSGRDAELRELALKGIVKIKEAYDQGNYVEAASIGQRLLGQGGLSLPQKIGVFNYLGFAYVALDRKDMAKESFIEAVKLQPGMELSPITTSPKILEVFLEAKEAALAAFDKQDAPDSAEVKSDTRE